MGAIMSLTRGVTIALVSTVALLAISPPSSAEADRAVRHRAKRQSVAEPPRVCQRLCVADVTPCDPMEYKIADGRCSDPFFRY